MLLAAAIALPTAFAATSTLYGLGTLVTTILDNVHLKRALRDAQVRAQRDMANPGRPIEAWVLSAREGVAGSACPYTEVGEFEGPLAGLLISAAETLRVQELLAEGAEGSQRLVGLLHTILLDQERRSRLANMDRAA